MAIDITNLAGEINRQLALYANTVTEDVDAIAKQVAKDGVKKLKANSPKLTGSYRKGWRVKKAKGVYIIHNKTDYQLTHLLEKGHAKVSGGRVPAKPHIAIVEQELIEEFEQGIIGAVEQ